MGGSAYPIPDLRALTAAALFHRYRAAARLACRPCGRDRRCSGERELSFRRAQTVADLLAKGGIPRDRLKTSGRKAVTLS
jgi:hypothetical protein